MVVGSRLGKGSFGDVFHAQWKGRPVAVKVMRFNANAETPDSKALANELIEDFIAAAVRSEKAGFDGVELHGAHGYILAQFLSKATNRRDDKYGGTPENRIRLLREVTERVASVFGADRTAVRGERIAAPIIFRRQTESKKYIKWY